MKLLNMTYFASFLLFPILLGAFGFAASPFVLRTKAQREAANYGGHGEEYSFFVYFGLIFMTMWVQFGLNADLNRKLNGDPYQCDPFKEDCSAVAQATRAAEAQNKKDEQIEEEELEEVEDGDEFWNNMFDF